MHRARLWALLVVAFYVASAVALYYYGLRKTLSISDYISDECWYVSSAINIGRMVLGLEPSPAVNSTHAAFTVFISDVCSIEHALSAVETAVPGAVVAREYSKVRAVAFYVPLVYAGEFEDRVGSVDCVVDVVPGIMPDAENINSYLNPEHPPFVKLVYALILYVAGFRLDLLRIVSFAFSLAGLAAAYAVVYWALKRWDVEALPALVLPLSVVVFDKSIQSMSSVAMLDIYASSLDAIAVALMLYGRPLLAAVAIGLSGASKYTGLFPLPALLVYAYLRGESPRRSIAMLTIPIIIVALAWSPFTARYGVGWVVEQVIGSLKWHTTSRPPGGPPTTDPLGLLLGRPGFTLYYVDSSPYLVAASNPGVTLSALAIAIIGLPGLLSARCRLESIVGLDDDDGIASVMAAYVFTILGYVAVWLAGNHTLYNFYSVQLSLLASLLLPLYPLLLRLDGHLRASSISECLVVWGGYRWIVALAAFASVFASPLLVKSFHTASRLQPLYMMLPLPPTKIVSIGLLLVAAAVYGIVALSTLPMKPRGRADAALAVAVWAAAGLASTASIESAFAPLLLLAASATSVGLTDGLLLGIIMPSYHIAVGVSGRRPRRQVVRFAAGYTAAVVAAALAVKLSGLNVDIYHIIAGLLAGLACWPLPPGTCIAGLAIVDPSLAALPLLAGFASRSRVGVAIALAGLAWYLAPMAPVWARETAVRIAALAVAAITGFSEYAKKPPADTSKERYGSELEPL